MKQTKKHKYDILRACGFEPKAARHFLKGKPSEELLAEVTARTLKKAKEEEQVKKQMKNNDPINPYDPKTPASLCFELLVEGHTRDGLLDHLETQMLEQGLDSPEPETVLAEFENRLGSEELIGFSVHKDSKCRLVLDRPPVKEKEEKKMTTTKRKAKKSPTTKSTKPTKKVKITASRDGANPWTPPWGAWAAMEELRIGGTMANLEKRVKARFKKDKIASHPVNRLHRIIYVIDRQSEPVAKGFKIVRKGKGKNQTLKAVKK